MKGFELSPQLTQACEVLVNLYNLESMKGETSPLSILKGVSFKTPWHSLEYVEIEPGCNLQFDTCSPSVERGYLVMEGRVGFGLNENSCLSALEEDKGIGQPAYFIGPINSRHNLTNFGKDNATILTVAVETSYTGTNSNLFSGKFDPEELKWRDAIHGGCGRIATRHVLKPEIFLSTWTFLDHAILGPESSVGYHYHDALEEIFIVVSGNGLVTVDDKTFTVSSGSLTWQGIGQAHGIYNPGPEPLEFVRVAVAQLDEPYTTIDLFDDLSTRVVGVE